MRRKIFSAGLIIMLITLASICFAGDMVNEKPSKLNKVQIIKPEIGTSKSVVAQDSLYISIKVADKEERYLNLVKIDPSVLEKSEDEVDSKEEESDSVGEVVTEAVVEAETSEVSDESTEVAESTEADAIEEADGSEVVAETTEEVSGQEIANQGDAEELDNTEEVPVVEENTEISKKELAENLAEAKVVLDKEEDKFFELEKKAKKLGIALYAKTETNLRSFELGEDELKLYGDVKKQEEKYLDAKKKYNEAHGAYMKSFETYIIEKEAIEIKGVLPIFDYVIKEIEEGDYRLEIVNVEKGVVEKQMTFKVISKESVAEKFIKKTGNLVEDLLKINEEVKDKK